MSYLPRTLFKGGKSSVKDTDFMKVQTEKEFLNAVKKGFIVSGCKDVKDMIESVPEVKSIFERREEIMAGNAKLNSAAGISGGEVFELKSQISELKKMVHDSNDQMSRMSEIVRKVTAENDELKKPSDEVLIEEYEKETGEKALIAGGPNKGKELKAFAEWKEKKDA
jgi:hypothetical protein